MVAPYATAETVVTVAGVDWRLKTLADRQQFHDPDGEFEAAGVAPAYWSLFGVTWEAGMLLAEVAASLDVDGRKMLELGSGLALPSLILCRRGAAITPSDVHPLAASFFEENCRRNSIEPVPYLTLDWRRDAAPGRFDLMLASDVLYESSHVAPLAAFIGRYCGSEFILTDPGRGHVNALTRALEAEGFSAQVEHRQKARIARYERSTARQ